MLLRDRNLILLIRVGNLMLASFAFLVSIMAEAGCHSALSSSSPHPHGPITIYEVVRDSIVILWFAGALGLFSRSRTAWVGSLVGSAATTCFFATIPIMVVWMYIFPTAETLPGHGSAIMGYIGVLLFAGLFSLLSAICFGLFIGLLKMRKEFR
jgi:hypothetical protein